jgi:hypothetical protein
MNGKVTTKRCKPDLSAVGNGPRRNTRTATPLTHRTIEALASEEEAYRVPDARCTGLAVRVAPSGLERFMF